MSTTFQIKIKGHLDSDYIPWIGRFHFEYTLEGETLLTGSIPDQAALHGIFNRLRDLGLTLISVNPLDELQEQDCV